jgi:hypothetical protein
MRHWMLGAALSLACISSAHADDWRISTGGYGPARIGMSVAEVAEALGVKLVPLGAIDDPACYYVTPQPDIAPLMVMVSHDHVVRFDVGSAKVASEGIVTRSGLGIGTTEAKVIETLGADAVEVTPHKYTGPEGHYLTVWSADRQAAVRFETLNGKVTSFYAGQAPHVTYVEGCS